MRLFTCFIVAISLVAVACGSDPETVEVGDLGGESADASDSSEKSIGIAEEGNSIDDIDSSEPVANDSAPMVVGEPCEIIGSGGPIDPAEVLIDNPGGRWGDRQLSVDSGRAEVGIDPSGPPTRSPCDAQDVIDDCLDFFLFLDQLSGEFRSTARDEARDHELDNYAADVGTDATVYKAAFDGLSDICHEVEFDGEIVSVTDLELTDKSAVELSLEGESVWLAALARENILSILVVNETEDDPLVEADLGDFERLMDVWQNRLENAPLS